MNNEITRLENDFNAAKETFEKAKAKFQRKQLAPEQNLRSVRDLQAFKLEMIDAELAMLTIELDLIAEREEEIERSNSVGKCQVELDMVVEDLKAGLADLGLAPEAFYMTSQTQAEIYQMNSVIKRSLRYKKALHNLKQAGQQQHVIEREAQRVAAGISRAEKERADFFASLRNGI